MQQTTQPADLIQEAFRAGSQEKVRTRRKGMEDSFPDLADGPGRRNCLHLGRMRFRHALILYRSLAAASICRGRCQSSRDWDRPGQAQAKGISQSECSRSTGTGLRRGSRRIPTTRSTNAWQNAVCLRSRRAGPTISGTRSGTCSPTSIRAKSGAIRLRGASVKTPASAHHAPV